MVQNKASWCSLASKKPGVDINDHKYVSKGQGILNGVIESFKEEEIFDQH